MVTVATSGPGLKTRTSRAPPSRRTALTWAPLTVSPLPVGGRMPPPWAGHHLEREEDVVGQGVGIIDADGQGVTQ